MALNFEGRFWTVNDTLVMVHPATETSRFPWTGHVIEKYEEDAPDHRIFYWDMMGKCMLVFGTADAVSKFDLDRRVNSMTYASQCLVREGKCERCDKKV